MARSLFIRHGETAWNADGRRQGWNDEPLNDRGRGQATVAAAALAALGLRSVVASDLSRATETAAIIQRHLALPPIAIDPDLREFDHGMWSGLTVEEIDSRWPGERAAWREGTLDGVPGGETRVAFAARIRRSLDRLLLLPAPTLVVAHGGVIQSMLREGGAPPVALSSLAGHWFDLTGTTARPLSYIDLLAASA